VLKRMFAKEPGQIRFTEEFTEQLRGCLAPGEPILLQFADTRIAEGTSGEARIVACVQYDGGPVQSVNLHLRAAWRDIDPGLTEPGEGNFWEGTITPPPGAREMSLWFVKTAPSGARYFDSRFGQNYWFRFVRQDLRSVDARIDAQGFGVNVDASEEISGVTVRYQVLNRSLASGDMTLNSSNAPTEGVNHWSGRTAMDPQAVISFDVQYMARGRSYTDDNQRRHYTVPNPDEVLEARRAAQKS
jgi:hypothetical protein